MPNNGPLSALMVSTRGADAYADIMEQAVTDGFQGFAGNCWAAAVAINRVFFAGRGEYAAGVNTALAGVGCLLGHAAIRYGDVFWDADGFSKAEEDITSWGMLDHEDSDYRELFDANGLPHSQDACDEASLMLFPSEKDFRKAFQVQSNEIQHLEAILRHHVSEYAWPCPDSGDPDSIDAEGIRIRPGSRWKSNGRDDWIEVIRVFPSLETVEAFTVTDAVTTGRFSQRAARRRVFSVDRFLTKKRPCFLPWDIHGQRRAPLLGGSVANEHVPK